MLTSVLCVCVVTNILHEGLHIVSFYFGCCTSNYNLPATLSPGEGMGGSDALCAAKIVKFSPYCSKFHGLAWPDCGILFA